MRNSTTESTAAHQSIDEHALKPSQSFSHTELTMRASLCLNNRGVQLLAMGCYKEASEVIEDAIFVLKSSGRSVDDGTLGRILKRKLGRAQSYLLRAPKLTSEPPTHWIHIVSGEDCLSRLGRLDVFAQTFLLAFRLESHDDLNHTSAVFLHNLALTRMGMGEYQSAARLLTMANTLLSKSSRITSSTVKMAMATLGSLQICYGECGCGEGLKECQEKMRMLRKSLKESGGDTCPSLSPYTLAAAA
jgi:hypothetical protein